MSSLKKITDRLHTLADVRYRRFYLQRRVQDLASRERRSDAIAAKLPRFEGVSSPVIDRAAAELKSQGYSMVSELIPAAAVKSLRDYFSTQPVTDPYRPELGSFVPPDNVPPNTHVAFFPNELIARAPAIYDIVNNPVILAAVARTLGGKPTIGYMAIWWSLPRQDGKPQQAENYHRDVDDWRFVKLFVYLTDVDNESGPHTYVPGSHNTDKLATIRRYDEEEVYAAFGPDCEKRFIGPAGTAFLENTYGFHRGFPPKSRPRLAIGVTYCIESVPYGPKDPVATIGRDGVPATIDPFINRVYCRPK